MNRRVLKVDMEYYDYNVTDEMVESIVYHSPAGEGDAHYCDVYFKNGTMKRIFRPKEVIFDVEESHE